MKSPLRSLLPALGLLTLSLGCHAEGSLAARADVQAFISEMVSEHQYQRDALEQLFQQTQLRPNIIEAMTRPAERKPWRDYRPIFLTTERIRDGVAFWNENAALLEQAERRYGVAPQYIVAILGVETRYGRFRGRHRVIDALSTLAFDYPPRSAFFRSELKHYLLMAREENFDPLSLTGSYAGAMGTPQFIPSSFRSYAVDFDSDGLCHLFGSMADIVGSVANYFKVHGWIHGGSVAIPAEMSGAAPQALLDAGLKPNISADRLQEYGIQPHWPITSGAAVALLALEGAQGQEHWITFNNFYVITRYNRSPLYAMAVHQLSTEILKARNAKPAP